MGYEAFVGDSEDLNCEAAINGYFQDKLLTYLHCKLVVATANNGIDYAFVL